LEIKKTLHCIYNVNPQTEAIMLMAKSTRIKNTQKIQYKYEYILCIPSVALFRGEYLSWWEQLTTFPQIPPTSGQIEQQKKPKRFERIKFLIEIFE